MLMSFFRLDSLLPLCSNSACGLIMQGSECESCTYHNENTIGKEGNEKPSIESTSLEKTQSSVSGFCYAQNQVCNTADLLLFLTLLRNPSRVSESNRMRKIMGSG